MRYGDLSGDDVALWGALHSLGILCSDQGKLEEAEEMYQRALAGYGQTLGSDHDRTRRVAERLNSLKIVDG